MAGPPDHRALPRSGLRASDPALGGAPRDGDFARLLEAASAPGAHRMKVDPEVEAWGSARRARPKAPYGPPGMNWGRALPLPGRSDPIRGDDAAARQASAPPGGVPALDGTDGRDDDRDGLPGPATLDAGTFGASASRTPRRGPTPWSGRPLRDRVVAVLFGIAGLSILLNVLDSASHGGAEDLGPLLVLAVVAFFVLRGWLRGRRPPGDSR